MTDDPTPQAQSPGWRPPRSAAVVLVIAIAATALLGALLSRVSSPASDAAVEGPSTVKITGAGTADVTIDIDGAVEQHTESTLPYSLTVPNGAGIISVSAQLSGMDFGNGISCAINGAGGVVLKHASSTGDYAVVLCAADLR